MGEKVVIDHDMTRVLDILAQVKKLNSMISMHQNGGNELMLDQYQDMKQTFLKELKDILIDFQIEVKILDQAA